jgi:penicillin amidase
MRRLLKVLKWTAIVLAALVAVLAVALVWYVRRPWPQVDGEVAVDGLEAPVEVVRDEWGVPQIYADSEHDLFFAQGFVHAQDRLWQMHLNRIVTYGLFSSVLGGFALDTDRFYRTLGLRQAGERDWASLDPEARAVLEAYSAGVNAYMDSHRGRLGLEFTLLGIDPEPWTPVDTLSWTKVMSMAISLNMTREMQRTNLRTRLGDELGADAARRLLAAYPESAPVVVPGWMGGGGGEEQARREPPPGFLELFAPALSPEQPLWGSNAWVVHGSRTETGKPLLANDTHLGLGMPSVWYENGLHGGRFDVAGFSFPGLPAVVIGHNGRIAWGIASTATDVQDLFVEKLDDPENPRRYEFMGEWRDLEIRHESIAVKGQEPVALDVLHTHHGPIVNGVFDWIEDEPPMALAWTAFGEVVLLRSLLDLDLAGDWQGFRDALSQWHAPGLSFVYADVAGNVGYQATGRHPVRAAGHDGSVPAPGWSGEHEWQGYVTFDELPRAFNPAAGYVVTANNKTVGEDYPYVLGVDWADPNRARRIDALLAADDEVSREDMGRFQADTYSLLAEELRPYLLAVEGQGELEARARAAVEEWDLRYEPDRVGAAVFHVWQWALLRNVTRDELGEEKLNEDLGVALQQHSAIDEMMAREDNPWFDDRSTPEVESRDDMVRRSLADAVAWLSERYGADPAAWRWGDLHGLTLVHQPLGQSGIAPLERIFNSDAMGGRGGPFTVFATTPSVARPFAVIAGSSQRWIADLADLGRSLAVNSTGQCAHAFHAHREDQVPLWYEVEYRPLRFSRESFEAEGTLTLRPGD